MRAPFSSQSPSSSGFNKVFPMFQSSIRSKNALAMLTSEVREISCSTLSSKTLTQENTWWNTPLTSVIILKRTIGKWLKERASICCHSYQILLSWNQIRCVRSWTRTIFLPWTAAWWTTSWTKGTPKYSTPSYLKWTRDSLECRPKQNNI